MLGVRWKIWLSTSPSEKNKKPLTLVKNSSKTPTPDLRTRDGNTYEVTAAGSLALLALGDIGLMAWRAKRRTRFHQDTQVSPTHFQKP